MGKFDPTEAEKQGVSDFQNSIPLMKHEDGVDYYYYPCTCSCHSNPGTTHIAPCCENGWIKIRKPQDYNGVEISGSVSENGGAHDLIPGKIEIHPAITPGNHLTAYIGPELDKSNYFVPEIEDIRVGYELEFLFEGQVWQTAWVDGGGLSLSHCMSLLKIQPEWLRVPYLTKEQIEAEGWKQLDKKSPFTGKPYKWQKIIGEKETGVFNEDHIYTLTTELLDRRISIHLEWESSWNRFEGDIYVGTCKDINTFRYICKLLNI